MIDMTNNTDILKKLDENGIEYSVLRGFIPIEEIDKSLDVDIYIPSKYKKKVHKIFTSLKWYTQKINCSRYPHQQYIYISNNKLNKIDIVYGLYYDQELRHFKYENLIFDGLRKENGVKILSPIMTLITFILHVLFDKKKLSEKNQKYLKLIYDDYKKNSSFNEKIDIELQNKIIKITKEMVEKNLELINKNIKFYKEQIQALNILDYSFLRKILYNIRQRLNNTIRYSLLKMSNRSICILGVDGSGKSTTTLELNKILGNKSIIQYMGFKEYELHFVKKHFLKNKSSNFYNLKSIVYMYFEMWKRYFKNRFSNNLIIYDRFPWEAVINNKGIAKFLYFIEFKILFPRPKKLYYLHCLLETSLSRKDDIPDKNKFLIMKNNFDKAYLNKKKIKAFSTDEKTTEEIVQCIIDDINKDMLKYLI